MTKIFWISMIERLSASVDKRWCRVTAFDTAIMSAKIATPKEVGGRENAPAAERARVAPDYGCYFLP